MSGPAPYWMNNPTGQPVDKVDEVDTSRRSGHEATAVDSGRRSVDTSTGGDGRKFKGDLTAALRELVSNLTGSFTTNDLYRWLGLTERSDKKRCWKALNTLTSENLIIKDRRVAGRYQVNRADLDFINLDATDEKPFGLKLPLGLDSMVSIPHKSIVVLAGSTNSGKTALALKTLRDNIDGPHPLLYLMSEMGPSDFKERVNLFGDDLAQWKKIKAAPLSAGFNAAISNHNQNGITVVDFLEEVEGEYYKIPSDIRGIYDALGDGVAFVVLQKATDTAFGRGGQGTAEKARLYLSLDILTHQARSTICTLKIVKAKSYTGDNPNGKERHFRIERGHKITPVSEWMYCDENQRAAFARKYANEV